MSYECNVKMFKWWSSAYSLQGGLFCIDPHGNLCFFLNFPLISLPGCLQFFSGKAHYYECFFFYLPLDSHTICILVDMQEEFIFGCLVLMLLILHNQSRQFGFQQVKIVERFKWSHQCFDQNIKLQSTISKFFDRCFEHLLKTNFSDTRWWCVVIDSYAQTTSSYMKIKIARDEYDVFTSFQIKLI